MSDLKSVSADNASDYLLKINDIVFARTGASTGRNYFYDGTDGDFVFAGFLIKFSLDPSKVNPRYVKYYCQSKEYRDWIAAFNTGSTRGNINTKTLASMPIRLPDMETQHRIVNILDALENKRKNNKQINDNFPAVAISCDKFLSRQKAENICMTFWPIGRQTVSFLLPCKSLRKVLRLYLCEKISSLWRMRHIADIMDWCPEYKPAHGKMARWRQEQ